MKHSFSATQQSHAGQRNSAELVLQNLIWLAIVNDFYLVIIAMDSHCIQIQKSTNGFNQKRTYSTKEHCHTINR